MSKEEEKERSIFLLMQSVFPVSLSECLNPEKKCCSTSLYMMENMLLESERTGNMYVFSEPFLSHTYIRISAY